MWRFICLDIVCGIWRLSRYFCQWLGHYNILFCQPFSFVGLAEMDVFCEYGLWEVLCDNLKC